MTALWIILTLVVYAAGFAITARAVNLIDRRWGKLQLGDGEDVMFAIMWPLVLLVVVVALPFVLLYRLAVSGLNQGE